MLKGRNIFNPLNISIFFFSKDKNSFFKLKRKLNGKRFSSH